jgi:F0F1-type ATP synthase assembly protein I
MAATKTTGNEKVGSEKVSRNDDTRRLFFISALNMSWQLAIAVLVPVVGGFKLDQVFNTLPGLTIIGFIMAIVGMVVIVQKQIRAFGPPPEDKTK